ncbi:hypothetical protein [Tenacibaculum jejuense]|uniref:Probable lipoprotein n=1 Tax=Tenacibaculum jejuense TaxID=584609 RepID=A0A238UEI3_9FLAO|nr:hypothetical protein [Tenacibaculum jejuense]SNR16998.1 Probable lipoprotein precursor [Tenacibaculum jejuense]
MRYTLIVLLFLTIACQSKKAKEKTFTEEVEEVSTVKDTIVDSKDETKNSKVEIVEENKLVVTDDKSIYVGLLEKIDQGKDYYIPVSFKTTTSTILQEDFHNNFEKYTSDVILKSIEYTRFKIEDAVANKYLEISNLNTILVFDDNQEVIDTLHLKNYEYFSGQLESQVIATYNSSEKLNENKQYVCVTINDFIAKNNYKFSKDSIYLKETLKENKFEPTDVYAHCKMIKDKDTISFLSFGSYGKEVAKHGFYLFKNKVPTDSIINKNLITEIIPTPLTLNGQGLFMTSQFIPDTDAVWTALVGIDFKTNQLKQYERNRVSLE